MKPIYLKMHFFLVLLCSVNILNIQAQALRPSFKFDFGAGEVEPGYIAVLPTSIYSEESCFGFDFNTLPKFIKAEKGNALKSDFLIAEKPFYFSVKLPEGNYEVKVLLGNYDGESKTTIKAESRRLMLENSAPKKGRFHEEKFIVNIKSRNIIGGKKVTLKTRELTKLDWDDKLTLEFAVKSNIAAIEITPVDHEITVYLAGNSTVVNQEEEPWASWGQMIPNFFKPGVAIANHAESGLTLGSFISSNRLEKVLSVINKGDYLFVEFGHNDQKEKGLNDGPYKSYTERLKYFVTSCRKKGAIPVIVTSTSRRAFNDNGELVETLGDYPDAARKVAAELNVALIDLNAKTKEFYKALGVENSKKAFVHYAANTYLNQTQALADNTHFNPYGAYEISKIIMQGIIDSKIGLKKYIKNFKSFDANKPDDLTSWIWPVSPKSDVVKPDGN